MIELGGAGAPTNGATPGANVVDGSDATFMADVIEASRDKAVIVDFWAPWCGPCKQLGPALEAAVEAENGRVKLVKINIDENPAVAGQLRVQSIPAVFGFVDGQPVDGFMGAQAGSEIQAFVRKLIDQSGGGEGGLDEALDMADQMLADGVLTDAAQTYAAVLGEDPANTRAMGGMIRSYIAAGDLERARQALEATPADIVDDPAISAARATLELAEAAAGAGELGELETSVTANPDDHQARFDLATAQVAHQDNEAAVDTLLELFRRAPDWNEGAAKDQLFKLFETFGPTDPLTLKGRRRLSSMIFS